MKQLILWTALCLASVASSQAQSVVASGGRTFISYNGALEWTLGEMVIDTYQQNPGYLTQGFHQTHSISDPGSSIEVYPNPTSNYIYLYYPLQGQYTISVFNMLGQKVGEATYSTTMDYAVQEMDFRNLSPTVYLMFIRNLESGNTSSFKIIKD